MAPKTPSKTPRAPFRVVKTSNDGAGTFTVYGSHKYTVNVTDDTVTPNVSASDARRMRAYLVAIKLNDVDTITTGKEIAENYAGIVKPVTGQTVNLPGVPGHTSPLSDATGAVSDAVSGVEDAITSPFKLFASSQFWIRAGEVTVGLIVVGVGLNAIVKEATGVNAGQKALDLTPIGRTAKAARRSDKLFQVKQAQRRSVFEDSANHYDRMTEKHAERAFRTSYSRGVGKRAGNE